MEEEKAATEVAPKSADGEAKADSPPAATKTEEKGDAMATEAPTKEAEAKTEEAAKDEKIEETSDDKTDEKKSEDEVEDGKKSGEAAEEKTTKLKETADEKKSEAVSDEKKSDAAAVKKKSAKDDDDDDEKDEEGEEDDEEDEKPKEPEILGRGHRVRKSTAAFKPIEAAKKKEVVIPEGKGEKLKDMPRVEANFKAITWSDPHLKMLYSVIFGMGKKKEFKSHLLEFNGLVYPEGKEEDERDRLKDKMYKLKLDELKAVMDLVDIDRSAESFGNKKEVPGKEALCNRFLEWLEEPKPSGKKLKVESKKSPGKRKSTGSAKEGSAKKASAKKAKKETPTKKKATPTKRKSSGKSETSPAKKAKKEPSAKKSTEKKAAAKSPSKSKSSSQVALDIPGVAIEKVREKVKNIVENANREELTVKGVRKLLEDWLDTDLSQHKDGIRSLVMEVM